MFYKQRILKSDIFGAVTSWMIKQIFETRARVLYPKDHPVTHLSFVSKSRFLNIHFQDCLPHKLSSPPHPKTDSAHEIYIKANAN